MHPKKKHKGQIFTWDLVFATALFLLILGIIIYQWETSKNEMLSSRTQYDVSWYSAAASEQLVRTTGTPVNWENSTPMKNVIFGLADYDRYGNKTTALDRIVDPDKLFLFVNASQNYTWMRNKLLATGLYDYYNRITCLNDEGLDCVNGLALEYVDNATANCSNNASLYAVNGKLYSDLNLSGAWHFSEGTGNIIHDLSGNRNDGILKGPNWSIGAVGTGLSFDGVNDYVNISNSPSLEFNGPITITAWARIGNNSRLLTLISKSSEYLIRYESWNHGFTFFLYDGVDYEPRAYTGTLDLDTWYFIAATWDGTDQKIYIDGVLEDTSNHPFTPTPTQNNVYLGVGIGYNLNGTLDEVRIYKRVLTGDEILELNSTQPRGCLLGRNTAINDTSYIAYDVKSFTFGGDKSNPALSEDLPQLNETARITTAVYKRADKA